MKGRVWLCGGNIGGLLLVAALALVLVLAAGLARAQQAPSPDAAESTDGPTASTPAPPADKLLFALDSIDGQGILHGAVLNRTGRYWRDIRLTLKAMDSKQTTVLWSGTFTIGALGPDERYELTAPYGLDIDKPGHMDVHIRAGRAAPPGRTGTTGQNLRLPVRAERGAGGAPLLTNRRRAQ